MAFLLSDFSSSNHRTDVRVSAHFCWWRRFKKNNTMTWQNQQGLVKGVLLNLRSSLHKDFLAVGVNPLPSLNTSNVCQTSSHVLMIAEVFLLIRQIRWAPFLAAFSHSFKEVYWRSSNRGLPWHWASERTAQWTPHHWTYVTQDRRKQLLITECAFESQTDTSCLDHGACMFV